MNTSKANEQPVWKALHEFVQWVLYVPAVLGLTIAFAFVFNLISLSRGDFDGVLLYLQTPLNAGLTATLYVWLSLHLAPRAPRVCAWSIYSLWSVFNLLAILRFLAIAFVEEEMSVQKTDVLELLQSIAWFVAGIYFLLRWGKDFAPSKSDNGA